eukprot:1488641-Rhodomonas_salina.1
MGGAICPSLPLLKVWDGWMPSTEDCTFPTYSLPVVWQPSPTRWTTGWSCLLHTVLARSA